MLRFSHKHSRNSSEVMCISTSTGYSSNPSSMRTKSSCPEVSTSIILDLVTEKSSHYSVHDFHPQIQMSKKKTEFFVFLELILFGLF